MFNRQQHDKGFTLVEMAVALSVLGLILVVAVPNFQDSLRRSQEDRVPAELESDVRMAVSRAKASGRTLRFVFSPNGYELRDAADSTQVIQSRNFGSHVELAAEINPRVFPWGLVQATDVVIEGSYGGSINVSILPTGRVEH